MPLAPSEPAVTLEACGHHPSVAASVLPGQIARVSNTRANRGRRRAGAGSGLLSTGQMARRSKVTARAVRFYEEAGLITPSRRAPGGRRVFSESELHKLQLISDLRTAGLPLESIRVLLETKLEHRSGPVAARAVLGQLDAHTDSLRARLDSLQRLLQDLEETRRMLRQCAACEGRRGYPAVCRSCAVVRSLDPPSLAVEVLWHQQTKVGGKR